MVPQNWQETSQATRNAGSRDTQAHPPAPLVSLGSDDLRLLWGTPASPLSALTPANWEPSLPRAVFSLCRAAKGIFSGQLPPASGRRRAGHKTPGAGEGGPRVRLRPARCVPKPRGESLAEGSSAPWWTFRVARPLSPRSSGVSGELAQRQVQGSPGPGRSSCPAVIAPACSQLARSL